MHGTLRAGLRLYQYTSFVAEEELSMSKHWWQACGIIGALVLFAGCGVSATSGTGGNANQPNNSPTTQTGGSINIATDHSIYTVSSVMTITIDNNTGAAIFGYDTKASCTILTLQMQQADGTWAGSNVARCPLGRPALPVTIAAGGRYIAQVQAGYPNVYHSTFPVGIYRLVLQYGTSTTKSPSNANMSLNSATFQVVAGA